MMIPGCEKEYSWDIKSDNVRRLVVDGMLTNENEPHYIHLSVTNPELNQEIQPATGANVTVTSDDETYAFTESAGEPGVYYSAPFQAVVGREYNLSILYEDSLFEAAARAVSVTPLADPVITGNEEDELLRYVHGESGQPAMLEVDYNWAAVPDFCSGYGNCYARETFFTLDNVDVNKIYGPEKQIIWFPEGTVLVRKKYSLSEGYQAFLRSMLIETEWRGGVFDVQHGNAPTNMSNGALGYFAVCMVVSDTIYVD
jgi:hypothetical protein